MVRRPRLCLLGNLSALFVWLEGHRRAFDPFLVWTWGGSRAIDNAITEFPYFTGLYADLHAHVVALPLTVADHRHLPGHRNDPLPEIAGRLPMSRGLDSALALLLGTLSATNAWDVPVYAALAVHPFSWRPRV